MADSLQDWTTSSFNSDGARDWAQHSDHPHEYHQGLCADYYKARAREIDLINKCELINRKIISIRDELHNLDIMGRPKLKLRADLFFRPVITSVKSFSFLRPSTIAGLKQELVNIVAALITTLDDMVFDLDKVNSERQTTQDAIRKSIGYMIDFGIQILPAEEQQLEDMPRKAKEYVYEWKDGTKQFARIRPSDLLH